MLMMMMLQLTLLLQMLLLPSENVMTSAAKWQRAAALAGECTARGAKRKPGTAIEGSEIFFFRRKAALET